MATSVYETKYIHLIDGTELYLTPLKIKYLREFMEKFYAVNKSTTEEETMQILTDCVRVSMKQYYPSIKTIEDVEDNMDVKTLYEILNIAGGIKINAEEDEPVQKQATENPVTWDSLDLAKLEAEAFLLGIWKDYNELEASMSMPELIMTLEQKRELDYNDKKFSAGLKGIDLDEQTGKSDAWEEMKARVFSKGKAADANDIVALQGQNAVNAGFGIGMGLDYEDHR